MKFRRAYLALAFAAAPLVAAPSALELALRLPAPLMEAFRRFDTNRDGKLTPGEWRPLVTDEFDAPLDGDGDGAINPAEFARSFVTVNSRQAPNQGLLAKRFITRAERFAAEGALEEAAKELQSAVQQFPTWAATWTALGEVEMARGRFPEARDALRKAVELAPNAQTAWLRLALSEEALGDRARAAEDLEKGLRLLALRLEIYGQGTRREAELGHATGEILNVTDFYNQRAGRPAISLAILERARAFLGPRAELEARRAWTEALADAGYRARDLDELTARYPANPELWAVKGRLLRRRGDLSGAIEAFRRSLSIAQRPGPRRLTLLDLYESHESAGRTAEASQTMQTVLSLSRNSRHRAEAIRALLGSSRYEQAGQLLAAGGADLDPAERALVEGDALLARKLLAEGPALWPDRYWILADLMERTRAPAAEVVKVLAEAVERFPDSLRLALRHSQALERAARDQEALRVVETALEKNPKAAELHLSRGRILSRMSSAQASMASLRRARELGVAAARVDAEEACALLNLRQTSEALRKMKSLKKDDVSPAMAQLLARGLLHAREWKAAAEWMSVAIQKGNDDPWSRMLLTQAKLESGDREGALASLLASNREKLPREPEAQFLMAGLLCRLGRPQDAVTHQKLGVELRPTDVRARIMLALLLGETGWHDEALKVIDDGLTRSDLPIKARHELQEMRRTLAEK